MISLLAYWWYLLIWYEPNYFDEIKAVFAISSTVEIVFELIGAIIAIWGWLYINEPWKKER